VKYVSKVPKGITSGKFHISMDGKAKGYGASLYVYKAGDTKDAQQVVVAAMQVSVKDMIDLIRVLKYYIRHTLIDYIKHI